MEEWLPTLQRLIAAEFEAMYAVSHPGRARLHGFGIFGGSNGYWRRDVLDLTRELGVTVPGGGEQFRFLDFDEDWIVATRRWFWTSTTSTRPIGAGQSWRRSSPCRPP